MSLVQAWVGDMNQHLHLLPAFSLLLNDQELARANRMKNTLLRDRVILSRGWLRTLLAANLAVSAKELSFSQGQYGKPTLLDHPLYFNVSHTNSYLAIVLADVENIGIDIEQIKSRPMLTDIAKRCFSDAEFSYWSNLPSEQQLQLFYQFWTKKEAFVKAVGRGLALGLDECEIDLADFSRFSRIPEAYGQGSDWQILDVSVAEEVSGALVVPNQGCELESFRLGDYFKE